MARIMTTPTIRRGAPEDAEVLSALAAKVFHDTFAVHNSPEDMKAYMDDAFAVERIREELGDPRAVVLLAYVDGELAGYAKVFDGETPESVPGASAMELSRLYADGRWHGRGVGAALMAACLDEARRAGRETIWLGVWERNDRAIAFYRKNGFVACGSHSFWLGADEQTDLLMARPVD